MLDLMFIYIHIISYYKLQKIKKKGGYNLSSHI